MADLAKLIEMLHSPEAATRFEACELLRVTPTITPEAIAALEGALHDPDPGIAESARSSLAVHLRLQGSQRGVYPSDPSAPSPPSEVRRAKNVYRWLWLSPLLTIPTVAYLSIIDPGYGLICGGKWWQECDYERAYHVSSLIAVVGSALWHLVLLIPALDRKSPFVRWHGRQALLLAGIRTGIPLSLAFYEVGGLFLSIPVLIVVWLAGNLWGQGQAGRGDCSLMRWTGRGAGLPLPTVAPLAPPTPSQAATTPQGEDHQAEYDLSRRLLEQGKRKEAARVLELLLASGAPLDLKTKAAERLSDIGVVGLMTADQLVAILRFSRDGEIRKHALAELQRLGLVESL